MSLLDLFIGDRGIRRIQQRGEDLARERYDPSVVDPIIDRSRRTATEGVPEELENIFRARTVSNIFRPQDSAAFGGRQSQAIASQQRQTETGQRALAGFEGNLAEQDIQIRRQAERELSEAQTQQRQIQTQQDTAVAENELQAEQERQRRRQQLGGAVAGIVGAALTTPSDTHGTTLAQRGLGAIFGQAVESSFLGREAIEARDEATTQLEGAREGMRPQRPQDDVVFDDIDFGDFEFLSPDPIPLPPDTSPIDINIEDPVLEEESTQPTQTMGGGGVNIETLRGLFEGEERRREVMMSPSLAGNPELRGGEGLTPFGSPNPLEALRKMLFPTREERFERSIQQRQ